jgi:very-short-patch-repair endonuclease
MWRYLDRADAVVAQIAGRQHGVARIDQLLWAGLSHTSVRRRVAAGLLHRVYRGVYAVGHMDLSHEGRWIAAVFACGPNAALSHDSAAHLWRYSPTRPSLIHVTVAGTGGRSKRNGIALHRSSTLTRKDVTLRHNIPVTTPQRTKLDMGWTTETTRSDLERKFFRLLRAHGLPLPEPNQVVGPYEIDILWREERLCVEIDSYAYHADRQTFVSDRARDRDLRRRGYTPMRFADEEVDERPKVIVEALLAALRPSRPGCAG